MKVNQAGSQVAASGSAKDARDAKETKGSKASKAADAASAAAEAKEGKDSKKAKTSGGVEGSAKAEISGKAREMAKAKEVASSAPDVREEKIQELRRRIAEGKYKVDPDAVADKIVQDHLSMPAEV